MKSSDIRKKFLDFFVSKEHAVIKSASLVPENDPTALFTIAGMQPLVPYLMGKPHPDGVQLVDSQKCFRTNDIDDVGDNRHLTFFEMLGNWSLGSYFKKESIAWSYEFLTKELGLNPERLLVTVFEGYEKIGKDNDSIALWKEVGMTDDRIYPCPPAENWWPEYGAQGPCGPDTEIYYDLKPGKPHTNPAYDDGRYIEIWNNVFMEYYCDGQGKFEKLAKQNVDTGGGLERFAMVLQGKETVFETDSFMPIIEAIEKLCGKKYDVSNSSSSDVKSMRIISDHIKAACFLIADGVSPSNEGRGYVLRRIIRRAVFNSRLLKDGSEKKLTSLLTVIQKIYKDVYPELFDREKVIVSVLDEEISKFLETLKKGEKLLMESITKSKVDYNNVLPAADAFMLYDTYGFPLSLTEEIAKLHEVSVDVDGFAGLLNVQKTRSRESGKDMFKRGKEQVQTMLDGLPKTLFLGYEEIDGMPLMRLSDSHVLKIITLDANMSAIITSVSVFYAESGGQVGDTGTIFNDDFHFIVEDTQKYDDVIVHFGHFEKGDIESVAGIGEKVECTMQVDSDRRRRIMAGHTGAHLLHKALKKFIGDSVSQAGSYVDEFRTRFDFHFGRALTADELMNIEREMNDEIGRWEKVTKMEMPLKEAQELGAIGLFTEKYGERVRVVSIGQHYSVELCGGTHVSNTSEVGIAKIIKESSVASGIRRIEMMTGQNVYEYVRKLDEDVGKLFEESKSASLTEVNDKYALQKAGLKEMEKLIGEMKMEGAKNQLSSLLSEVYEKDGVRILESEVVIDAMEDVKKFAHLVKDTKKVDVGLIWNMKGDFVIFSGSDKYSCKDILSKLSEYGAKGGGSPVFAQGVGLDAKKISGLGHGFAI